MRKFLIIFEIFFLFTSCEVEKRRALADEDNINIILDEESADSMNDETFEEIDDPANDENEQQDDIETKDEDNEPVDEDIPVLPVEFESGFIEIEPVNYTLDTRAQTSARARMWYNFQPADESAHEKPLFVFFNGGPGAATALLFTYNTSKMTADQKYSELDVVENEFNWNQIGNLLYIDARMTGFSYGMTGNPSSQNERSSYFRTNNFNVFIDAADFIRVILRFLARHPDIQQNKVILVGESYGGTRATAMLNILLNVRDYADNNRVFHDKALFDEIDAHFMKINPEISALPHKEIIKQQFAGQILVQPLVAGEEQFTASGKLLEMDGSPIYEVENETGVDYKPCSNSYCEPHNNALQYLQKANRDMYSYRRPYNWLFDYTATGSEKMVELDLFEKLIKNDPREIEWLYSGNRSEAFRYSGLNYFKGLDFDMSRVPDSIKTEIEYRKTGMKTLASGDLEQVFGILQSWDDYFIDLHYDVTQIFYNATTTPYSSINGYMFLENIRDVKTFITQSEEDIIIYAPGIPESLKDFSGVNSVETEAEKFTVKFSDNVNAEVIFPFYPESSHSVSVNQPEMFLNDVKEWLNF